METGSVWVHWEGLSTCSGGGGGATSPRGLCFKASPFKAGRDRAAARGFPTGEQGPLGPLSSPGEPVESAALGAESHTELVWGGRGLRWQGAAVSGSCQSWLTTDGSDSRSIRSMWSFSLWRGNTQELNKKRRGERESRGHVSTCEFENDFSSKDLPETGEELDMETY